MSDARPELGVLHDFGCASDILARDGGPSPGVALLGKPFSPVARARAVREILDRPG